jgi:hypothetical protein
MTMEELCTASRYGLTSEETFMTVTNNLVGFHGMRMPAALSSHFYVIMVEEGNVRSHGIYLLWNSVTYKFIYLFLETDSVNSS